MADAMRAATVADFSAPLSMTERDGRTVIRVIRY